MEVSDAAFLPQVGHWKLFKHTGKLHGTATAPVHLKSLQVGSAKDCDLAFHVEGSNNQRLSPI
jgi:hypothetical protein